MLPQSLKDILLSRATMQLNKKCPRVCYPHTGVHCHSSHTTRCARYPWSVTVITLTDQDRLPVMQRAHLLLVYTEGTGSASLKTFLSTCQATRHQVSGGHSLYTVQNLLPILTHEYNNSIWFHLIQFMFAKVLSQEPSGQ